MAPSMLDALIAGRWIQQLNLGLNIRKPGVEDFIRRHADRIGAWMATV
jgi:hypothetical protein